MLQFSDVQDAAKRLKGVAHRTPVVTSHLLDEMLGCQVLMKAENLQRTGAFKFRGGYNAVSLLSDAERRRGVVAFSAGNHSQAVALAARLHGCSATIVMPNDAPRLKLDATRAYGAEVVGYDRQAQSGRDIANQLVKERDAVLISPFDNLPVMAGQGTAALELIEDAAGSLDAMIVGVGGGGLLGGCAIAAKHLLPNIEVFGAEPERGNDVQQSLRAGHIVGIEPPRTICDGLQTRLMGVLPFEVIREHVTDVLTASDPETLEAMRFAFERLKLVLEPAGACGLATLMRHRERFRGQRVGVMLSGGNIDTGRFVALLTGAEKVD